MTTDKMFPVIFRVAPDDVAFNIVRRINYGDFSTEAGVRTASTASAGLNVLSNVPLELRRIRLVRAIPLNAMNSPPTSTLPSAWTANAYTVPSTPAPTLKFK